MARHEPHYHPGMLTPSGAEALADTSRQVEIDRRMREEMPVTWTDCFPASVTSGAAGVHAWAEQDWTVTGARYTKPAGRTGTVTSSPAVMMDGSTLTSFPQPVWLRRTHWTATLGVVYEVVSMVPGMAGGGGLTLFDTLLIGPNSHLYTGAGAYQDLPGDTSIVLTPNSTYLLLGTVQITFDANVVHDTCGLRVTIAGATTQVPSVYEENSPALASNPCIITITVATYFVQGATTTDQITLTPSIYQASGGVDTECIGQLHLFKL